ncbi:Minichromosome maintenance protein MCM [uncultured archaeon]|nr:Minichromosome maintenance protein MCM [uncultured archaeon]
MLPMTEQTQSKEFIYEIMSDLVSGRRQIKGKSLEVKFEDLEKFDRHLAEDLIERPEETLKQFKKEIKELESGEFLNIKIDYLRFYGLPEIYAIDIRELGEQNLGKLIRIEGVCNWITLIKPRIKIAVFQCNVCGLKTRLPIRKGELEYPKCATLTCKGAGKKNLQLLEDECTYINHQKAQLQEFLERMKGNIIAANVELWIEDDLTNYIAPGEKINATGILRLRPTKDQGNSTIYVKYLEVIHLEKREQEFEDLEISKEEEQQIQELAKDKHIYEKIVNSIAPSIYGYREIKQAIALQLFGGTPNKVLPDGKPIRNDMHILLIGEPGCLVAGERVFLGNGAIRKIDSLGEKHLQKINYKVINAEGGGKTDTATVFHKYEKQPVIELILESGKKIAGTHNHPLMSVESKKGIFKHEWKRLDEFKIGDKLQVVTGVRCTITKPIPTKFKAIPKQFGPRFKGKLPKIVDSDLAGLMGYITGDGWVTKYKTEFVVNEEEKDLVSKLKTKIEKLFSIKPAVRPRMLPGRKMQLYYSTIQSQDIAFNLKFLREKRVPELIFESGNKVAKEYIKWLFEADGTVINNGRGKRGIGLKSTRIELLRDVQTLLLRFSIHSRIVGEYLYIRRGNEIIQFNKEIGFASKKKKDKLTKLAKDAKTFARLGKQRFEKIVRINHLEKQTVYDIEVPKSHRFIANGIVSHNTAKSTLLQYVARLAPKCIMVSGKGASGVGLTASAEKDESGEGWILKAGAMVLASGGQVNIDEFDKMEKEDRSAIHEALEQQSISIAKAGIVTTMKTKTAVLAAANPKYGRFDLKTPLSQQFDIPVTLLSRFDLIFTVKDTLDQRIDEKTAQHIITGHIAAAKHGVNVPSEITPVIEIALLRKFIAYSRKTMKPVLQADAAEKIKDYYLELRNLGREQNTYPVTARQIEGLIRLAEATAKIRLSDKVEVSDAERAIALVEYQLKDVFTDKETGKIDSDIINLGQPKSNIDRKRTISEVIKQMEAEVDLVSIEELIKKLKEYEIPEDKSSKVIEEMLKEGMLYQPKPGHVKVVYKTY